jgi:hypothetical protein
MRNDSSFNTDFWVAVAAAAPVIVLSCVVLLTDQLSLISKKTIAKKARLPKAPKVTAWHLANASYLTNSANLVFQALSFIFALNSLAAKKPFVSPGTIINLEAFSLPLLLLSSGVTAISKMRIRRAELAEKASLQKKALDSNMSTAATNGYKNAVKLRIGSPRFNIVVYRKESENKSS